MARDDDADHSLKCSFCGKTQEQVRRLIAGPAGVYICVECVGVCNDLIEEELGRPDEGQPTEPPRPREIHRYLDQYVIGQEDAKRALAVAVYNHYKRVRGTAAAEENGETPVELAKSNILLLGPTGCGKTYLAQTLARSLNVPFAIADATALTEAGYVGEDVENILLKLLQAADFDVARAETGIIYLDEIDKISRKSENPSLTRDVSGEGVQQALLKIMEGTVAAIPPQGGRKHPQQELIELDTSQVLFIAAGAFAGLETIVGDRLGGRGIGFGGELRAATAPPPGDPFAGVQPADLVRYGLIPEFIGRLPVITRVTALDRPALLRTLTEPRNALVKQYQRLFELDGVRLEFDRPALDAIIERAMSRGTGARALRGVMERVLQPLMYEIPGRSDIRHVVVDERTVVENADRGRFPRQRSG